ncbi:MAG: hypothetical protein WBP41_09555 [Saprospiraceae bacterium]
MRKNEIIFNKIYILQSLFSNERKTGDEIFNVIKIESFKNNEVQVELINIHNKLELISTLNKIDQQTNESVFPLIHFEMHGSSQGIGINNGEFVPWEEVAIYLRKINVAIQNNLFVSLATCYGSYLLFSCDPTKPSPFFGYIGPTEKIGNLELEADFTIFFQILLLELNFKTAIESIDTDNTKIYKYKFVNCFDLFDLLVARINKANENPRIKNLRIKRLVNEYKDKNPGESKNLIRKRIQMHILKDEKILIDNMKKVFTLS